MTPYLSPVEETIQKMVADIQPPNMETAGSNLQQFGGKDHSTIIRSVGIIGNVAPPVITT